MTRADLLGELRRCTAELSVVRANATELEVRLLEAMAQNDDVRESLDRMIAAHRAPAPPRPEGRTWLERFLMATR